MHHDTRHSAKYWCSSLFGSHCSTVTGAILWLLSSAALFFQICILVQGGRHDSSPLLPGTVPSRRETRKRSVPDSDEENEEDNNPDVSRPIPRKRPSPDFDKELEDEMKPYASKSILRKRPAPDSDSDKEYVEEEKTMREKKAQPVRSTCKVRRDSKILKRARKDPALQVARSTQESLRGSMPERVNKAAAGKQGSPQQSEAASPEVNNVYAVGTELLNFFPGYGWYKGIIHSINKPTCTVVYEDGDTEEFLHEGPKLDALVELAKTHPSVGLENPADGTATADIKPVPVCAGCQGRLGQGQADFKEGSKLKQDERRSGMGAEEETVEHDEMRCTDASESESLMSLKTECEELEILIKKSSEATAEDQAELKNMCGLLGKCERLCGKKEQQINQLNARVLVLKQNQYMCDKV